MFKKRRCVTPPLKMKSAILLLLLFLFFATSSALTFDLRAILDLVGARHLDDVAGERRGGARAAAWLRVEQFDFKNQSGVRRDAALALFAVGQLGGMNNFHLEPTGIFSNASVQPGMTPPTGKEAGWPRL